jgi:hypothetical protein
MFFTLNPARLVHCLECVLEDTVPHNFLFLGDVLPFNSCVFWYLLHGLCQVNTQQGPMLPAKWVLRNENTNRHAAGTSSHLLLAGEKGLSLVIVPELTPCQAPHLETVMKKEEAWKPGSHDPAIFFLLLYLLIHWLGVIDLGPQSKYRK